LGVEEAKKRTKEAEKGVEVEEERLEEGAKEEEGEKAGRES